METEKLKILNDKIDSLKAEIGTMNDSIDVKRNELNGLYEELTKVRKAELINKCTNGMTGGFYKYEYTDVEYVTEWYIYFDKIIEVYDEEVKMGGQTVALTYKNNGGNKGNLVSFTYDLESSYMIYDLYEDPYMSYLMLSKLKDSTLGDFFNAKDKIKEL